MNTHNLKVIGYSLPKLKMFTNFRVNITVGDIIWDYTMSIKINFPVTLKFFCNIIDVNCLYSTPQSIATQYIWVFQPHYVAFAHAAHRWPNCCHWLMRAKHSEPESREKRQKSDIHITH